MFFTDNPILDILPGYAKNKFATFLFARTLVCPRPEATDGKLYPTSIPNL